LAANWHAAAGGDINRAMNTDQSRDGNQVFRRFCRKRGQGENQRTERRSPTRYEMAGNAKHGRIQAMQDEENLMNAKMNEAGAKSGDERFTIAGRSPAIFQPLPHRHLLTTAGHFQPSRGGGMHAMSRRLLSIRERNGPGRCMPPVIACMRWQKCAASRQSAANPALSIQMAAGCRGAATPVEEMFGALTQGSALVLPKPGEGGCRPTLG